MKTLIITAVLALGLGYHATSGANESEVNLLPNVDRYEVREDLMLSDLPLDLFDSFNLQKSTKPGNKAEIQSQDDRDFFYAIGVPFNFIDAI